MLTVTAQTPSPTRFHPRVDAGFLVKLDLGERTVLVRAEDLSMAGLKLLGALPNLEERVTVALPLPDDREIVTAATVRRRHGDEVALEFDQLDWEDMFALARYLHPRLR